MGLKTLSRCYNQ